MKDILYFLELQKAVDNGLTQEQINKKLIALRNMDENTDISERDYFRLRKKVMEEIRPHQKNNQEYNRYLHYFAGKITSMAFISRDYLKWKSEEKRNEYVAEREEWRKERDQILKTMSIPEILKRVIEKEKNAIALKQENLRAEMVSLDKEVNQLNAIDDLITFTEDVKSFDKSDFSSVNKPSARRKPI